MYVKLQQLIDKAGITPYRLAKDLDISISTVYYWKSGRCRPSADMLLKLAKYFNVTMEELLR